jgi:hypothetical protein
MDMFDSGRFAVMPGDTLATALKVLEGRSDR